MQRIIPIKDLDYVSKVINGGWLTVNRACNLRCSWCYASGSGFNASRDMDFDLAIKLVGLFRDIGARSIILIGGEPTVYKHLIGIVRYIRKLGMTPALVTNGIRLASRSYCEKLKEAGLTNITMSIKGASQEQYIKFTKTAGFEKMLRGAQNLRKIGIDPTFELTVVKDYLPNLEEMLLALANNGVNYLTIDLASPVITSSSIDAPSIPNPNELRDAVHRIYRAVDSSKMDYVIYMTIPFCLLDPGILFDLKEQGRLTSSCHVPHGNSLIFDEHGMMLACNHMAEQPLGQYGRDFSDSGSFWNLWNTREFRQLRQASSCFPAEPCKTCPHWHNCGGGCMIKWMYWDPSQHIPGPSSVQKGGVYE